MVGAKRSDRIVALNIWCLGSVGSVEEDGVRRMVKSRRRTWVRGRQRGIRRLHNQDEEIIAGAGQSIWMSFDDGVTPNCLSFLLPGTQDALLTT